jgi:hypothetical protein
MSFNNYINGTIINHELETESSISINYNTYNHYGGSETENIDIEGPTGGFPPIFICTTTEVIESNDSDDIKTRQYISHKNSVSIKDIMDKRKSVTPFISLSGISNKKKVKRRKKVKKVKKVKKSKRSKRSKNL